MSSGGAGRPNRPKPTPSELPTRTELNTPSTPGVCGLGSGQHPAGGSESQPHALHLIRQPSSCPRLEWTPVGAAGGASLSLAVMEAEQLGQRARAGEALVQKQGFLSKPTDGPLPVRRILIWRHR